MQDRYTGDIGDFGKYGLLRSLTSPETGDPPRLGIVWYLTPGENQSPDGQHTGYLHLEERKRQHFTACDEELYLALQGLVDTGNRSVNAVQESGILPEETLYHSETLALNNPKRNRGKTVREAQREKREKRESWNQAALEKTKGCDIVFLDPDNGLETASAGPNTPLGAKYAFHTELESYLNRGQSLVIHHHLSRRSKSLQQVHRKQRGIYEKLGRRAFIMRYHRGSHRGSPRAFILIPQDGHRREILERTRQMLNGPWGRHFTMIG